MAQIAAGRPTNETITEAAPTRLWTRVFGLILVGTLFSYASGSLLNPILPLYVETLGGSTVLAGFVFTAFSVTSFFLRPLVGHLTDSWNVRGVFAGGSAILGLLALALLIPSMPMLFLSNAIRGIGWGGINTAGPTAVAMSSPPSRRGEASGHFSVMTTAAYGLTPAGALWLYTTTGSFAPVILLAGLFGLMGAAVLYRLPPLGGEGQSLREALTWHGGPLGLDSFVDRGVLLASMLLICMSATTPVVIAFVPLHALSLNVENFGLYFVVGSFTSIVARLLLGGRLDRGSRGQWLVFGYGTIIVGLFVLLFATSLELFLVASVIGAVGQSIANPTLLAVAMDRAERSRMGKAMATFSMFYRAGEGIGAPIAGGLIVLFGFTGMYVGAIASVTLGIALAFANWRFLGRPIAALT